MELIQKAKDLEADAKKRGFRSIVKEKEEFVQELMGGGVFEKMSSGENHFKCTTCSIKLAGKPGSSKILSQLFAHFISDKHISRLRVSVKAEMMAPAPTLAARPEPAARPTPTAGTEDVAPVEVDEVVEPVVPIQAPMPTVVVPIPKNHFLTEDEAAELIKNVQMVYKPTPSLHMCLQCKTGLMTARFMMRHVETEEHANPTSIWSQQHQRKQEWR